VGERPLAIFVAEDPSSLNTVLNSPYGWQLGPLTQGYLFLVDERGRLVPDRALEVPSLANGGISRDGLTIVYRIRTGRWSDGAPFDARDVAFTVAALRNPRTNVPDRSTVEQIASVSAPRPDRLVVRLRQPSAPFVSSFLTLGADDPFAILPRHVAARYSDLNRSSLDAEPVGLGPFRLARWRRGERLEFVRNPWYWRGPAGLARVVALVEPDATTRFIDARRGDLDVTAISGLEVDEAARSGARVVFATTNIEDFLQFNMHRVPALRDRYGPARAGTRPGGGVAGLRRGRRAAVAGAPPVVARNRDCRQVALEFVGGRANCGRAAIGGRGDDRPFLLGRPILGSEVGGRGARERSLRSLAHQLVAEPGSRPVLFVRLRRVAAKRRQRGRLLRSGVRCG
jgi:peptide/nickel transport system substrate-binding protein